MKVVFQQSQVKKLFGNNFSYVVLTLVYMIAKVLYISLQPMAMVFYFLFLFRKDSWRFIPPRHWKTTPILSYQSGTLCVYAWPRFPYPNISGHSSWLYSLTIHFSSRNTVPLYYLGWIVLYSRSHFPTRFILHTCLSPLQNTILILF